MSSRSLTFGLAVALLSACGDSYSSGPDNDDGALTGQELLADRGWEHS